MAPPLREVPIARLLIIVQFLSVIGDEKLVEQIAPPSREE
jgi:hypothetical protein